MSRTEELELGPKSLYACICLLCGCLHCHAFPLHVRAAIAECLLVQANGLNVSRVFLYNLDYGPSSQVPQYAPSPPAAPSVQVPGPNPRGPPQTASALAPAPALAAAPPADAPVADEAGPSLPGQQAPVHAAGTQSNAALLGGENS